MIEHAPLAITAIIGTRNRCAALATTLAAFTQLEIPQELTWELIVVDNGSTDGTAALLASFASRLPLRTLYEPTRGLSMARNAGLRAARGRVIVFTDDDCVVDRQWLAAIHAEFERDPELAGLGGRVELYDPRDYPITVRTSRERATLTNLYQLGQLFVGCNIAFRRSTVDRVGEFDPTLGPGTRVSGGDDMDFLYRTHRRALKLVYVPEVVVFHNHGRRTDEQVARLRRSYALGRGAFACKYLLQGDRGALQRVTAELRWHAREFRHDLRRGRVPRRSVRTCWHIALGAMYWLAARRPRVTAPAAQTASLIPTRPMTQAEPS